MLTVSICVCAYNEADNIEHAVRSVYRQTADGFKIEEVIVISSGSTDNTDGIVERLTEEFDTLTLVRQGTRFGKNSAINEFLERKRGDVSVLLNADNILRDDLSLHHLITPFGDEKVGMVGGHPVPTNDPKDMIGFTSHMIWTMHHHVSRREPKIGELIAFRDIGTRLPTDTQSDEDMIKMELEKNGFVSVYAPNAIVLNRGPGTREDFFAQRVRVNIGEEYMKRTRGYFVSTHKKGILFFALFGSMRDLGFHPIKMMYAVILEAKARQMAKAYVNANKDDINIWSRVNSTKDVRKDRK